jgi:hypothetical protein
MKGTPELDERNPRGKESRKSECKGNLCISTDLATIQEAYDK